MSDPLRRSVAASIVAAALVARSVPALADPPDPELQAQSQSLTPSSSPPSLPPSSPSTLHVASGVVALVGAAVAVAALVVPLFVCGSATTTDDYGRSISANNPCQRASNGLKIGWIATGGAGLSLAVAGGIVFFMTAEPPPSGVSRRDPPRLPGAGLMMRF